MDQTKAAESEWDDVFDLLDTRGRGYLTADDIVQLSRDVQNSSNDHDDDDDDDAVVSVQMAERMLAHLTRIATAPHTAVTTAAPTLSRAEFGQFMAPSPPPPPPRA
jgi:hypothetical protein